MLTILPLVAAPPAALLKPALMFKSIPPYVFTVILLLDLSTMLPTEPVPVPQDTIWMPPKLSLASPAQPSIVMSVKLLTPPNV